MKIKYLITIVLITFISSMLNATDLRIEVDKHLNLADEIHVFYANDTLLVHEFEYTLNWRFVSLFPDIDNFIIKGKRIINFNTETVLIVFPKSKCFTELDFNVYRLNYQSQRDSLKNNNIEKNHRVNKPYKKRSKAYRDKRIRKYGLWKDRFNWIIDTVAINKVSIHDIDCIQQKIVKMGVVKKRKDDTLLYHRKIVFSENLDEINFINKQFSKLLHIDNYWKEFTLNYRWNTHNLGEWVDTTTLDFIDLEKNQIPIESFIMVSINKRKRNPILMISDYVDFADEDILRYMPRSVYLQESVQIKSIEKIDFIDSVAAVPKDYTIGFVKDYGVMDYLYKLYYSL